MNAPNMQQMNQIRDLANQYAAIPEQYLLEGLGREPSLEEFAAFIEASAANILGGMYGILRDAKNPQEAEGWLKRTLGLTSALVRMRGSDAILKFDVSVKEVPNTLHKKPMLENAPKEPLKEATPEPAVPVCQCAVDHRGLCTKCSGILAAYFQGVFQPFMKMKELGEQMKGMCPVCQPAQTDFAMASVLPMLLKFGDNPDIEKKKAVCQEILASLYSMAAMMGAQELPMTDKAYVEAMTR